jgi:hypothetical protein
MLLYVYSSGYTLNFFSYGALLNFVQVDWSGRVNWNVLRTWLPKDHCLQTESGAFKVLNAIICKPWPPLAVELANFEWVLKGGISSYNIPSEVQKRMTELGASNTHLDLPKINLKCKSKIPALGILKRSINRMKTTDPGLEFKDWENDYYLLRVRFWYIFKMA